MKISVIVPIYGVEKYIENSIKSLINQTFNDFELVLVDDGTLDDSIKIAIDILKYSTVKYKIISQKNQGVSAARNNGIKQSEGDWIICVDPDDIFNKDFLKILYNNAIKHNVQVSICNYQMVNEKTMFTSGNMGNINTRFTKEQVIEGYIYKKIPIISPAMLVDKNLIYDENLWYYEDMKFSEDMHFIWRTLFTIDNISYTHDRLYNYVRREGSTMTSSNMEKIKTGYGGFCKLNSEMKLDNSDLSLEVKKFIFPRWIMGVLRTSSKNLNYSDFKKIASYMEYKKNTRILLNFPDYKIKVLTFMIKTNLWIFYMLNKKIG